MARYQEWCLVIVWDYIFIENGGTDIPGIIDFNNLNPKSGYRFHVFGCRDTETDRMGLFTFSGENSSTGTYKMGGKNSGGNGINHTTDRIYVSDVVYPDANGSIRFNIDLYADKFAHINAMKIEECTNDPVIKATSITLTGQDITESGQTSQIQARVLPEGAIFPAIPTALFLWEGITEKFVWEVILGLVALAYTYFYMVWFVSFEKM